MENNIPTAEEFVMEGHLLVEDDEHRDDLAKSHIEFTKLHVRAALKEASKNAEITDIGNSNQYGEWVPCNVIDKDSILNAYPLDRIK